MATVEIDEAELAQLKTLQSNAQRWMSNPDARRKVLEAQKLIDPNAAIPELDAAKPINEALEKLNNRFSEVEKKLTEDMESREKAAKLNELNSRWESGRVKLRGEGYTEDGIKKIEELMEKEGIANHEAGAAYFDKLNPPDMPVTPLDSGFDMLTKAFTPGEDEADRKALFENPDAWANGEVNKTLRDIRKK